jgi:Spy/CpxP family protein refolding chaperone
MRFLRTILLALAAALALPALAQDQSTSNMEILLQKVKADKKLLVAQNLQLTEAEAKAFWPVYDAYQNDLQKINQRLGTTIAEYADAYNQGPVANETAKKLLNEALAIEEAEVKLKRAYVPKLEKALPAAKVARYVQIENKIRAAIRYELAGAIPLVD